MKNKDVEIYLDDFEKDIQGKFRELRKHIRRFSNNSKEVTALIIALKQETEKALQSEIDFLKYEILSQELSSKHIMKSGV